MSEGSEQAWADRGNAAREPLMGDLDRAEEWGEHHVDVFGGCLVAPLSFDQERDEDPQHLHLFVVESPPTASAVAELSATLDHPECLVVHPVTRPLRELRAFQRLITEDEERWPPDLIPGVGLDIRSNAVWVRVLNRDPNVIERLNDAYGDALVYSRGWPSEELAGPGDGK